jgi:hypothetical protein
MMTEEYIDGMPLKVVRALVASPKTHPNVRKAWAQKLKAAEQQVPRRMSKLSRMS